MKETRFFKQAELLLQILPFFSEEKIFALKGGTAINFFIRSLPRLSIDIDFTYLPVNLRNEAINEISSALEKPKNGYHTDFPFQKLKQTS